MENRVIKFRAWDKAKKIMSGGCEWGLPMFGMLDLARFAKEHYQKPWEDWVVMQFTGLKDKNDKEIYEGDLLKAPHNGYEPRVTREVVFQDGKFVCIVIANWNSGRKNEPMKGLVEGLEVIGNIYENKELLN